MPGPEDLMANLFLMVVVPLIHQFLLTQDSVQNPDDKVQNRAEVFTEGRLNISGIIFEEFHQKREKREDKEEFPDSRSG